MLANLRRPDKAEKVPLQLGASFPMGPAELRGYDDPCSYTHCRLKISM